MAAEVMRTASSPRPCPAVSGSSNSRFLRSERLRKGESASTHRPWSGANGASAPSSWLSPRCTSTASPLAASSESPKSCRYVVLDARYEKVRIGGNVVGAAVLLAMGVREDGKRTILGVSVATSEAEVHWRAFIESLLMRGLNGVQLVTSDDHPGIKAALAATLPGVAWQRCQFHMQRNAQAHVSPVALRPEVAEDIRGIFNSTTEADAKAAVDRAVTKYEATEPKLASWIAENVHEGLAVLQLPAAHRRRLRTSNAVERLNREIKRRSCVATLFPNEAALLRLVTALAIEVSEDWETGRKYLSMDQR